MKIYVVDCNPSFALCLRQIHNFWKGGFHFCGERICAVEQISYEHLLQQVSYKNSLQQVNCLHSFCCTDREKEFAKLLNEGQLIIRRSACSLLVPLHKQRECNFKMRENWLSVANLIGVLPYLLHCTDKEKEQKLINDKNIIDKFDEYLTQIKFWLNRAVVAELVSASIKR